MTLTLWKVQHLRNLVFLLWAVPCIAAPALNGEITFEQITLLAYIITFVSSTLGGLAGTLHRMARHLEAGAQGIQHPKIFVAANMLGGWAAGWFMFLLGTHLATPVLMVQGLVLLASFGGATIVERFVDKYFPAAIPKGKEDPNAA
jgi:hypothetical protein